MRSTVPIHDARIGYLTGHFRPELAASKAYAFALYARPVNLLREPCTCYATGSCPVCLAWQDTMKVNHERRFSK